jgi:sterol desaturase/sphingolipid hydroxylase (fatty acid hydroxylase superfamily)
MSTKLAYWFDFIWAPLAVASNTALYARSWSFAVLALAGFVLFTFAEYWVHRLVLHRWFYHGTHEMHHVAPSQYVTFAVWKVPAFFALMFFVMPPGLFMGFVLSYCWFILWHHLLHHVDLNARPLLAHYARWHLVHHRAARWNFGITTPLWDRVFGTYRVANG